MLPHSCSPLVERFPVGFPAQLETKVPPFPLRRMTNNVVQTFQDLRGDQNSMKSLFLFILFPSLLLCSLASAQQNVRTIFLVRHAEKSGADSDTLSPAGEKRAECLAKMLKDANIKTIYVTDAKRTQQTAAPLAKALKLTPTILPAKDPNTLIRDLFYGSGGDILVVGHSDTLPFILARIKAGTVPAIADNEYDRLFVVTISESAATPVTTLRYCDCATPAPAVQPAPKKAPPKKR
jgi:phosphohistidine phosphatase SixA